jgi:hypothetical protein
MPGIMDFDSIYYAAAIAGNFLGNDSIDSADPCFSLRPGPKIRWHKMPTIAVGSPPDSVCGIGCANVQFDFEGAPPFQFTWEISQNGQVLFARTESVDGFQLVVVVCPEDFDLPADDGYFNFQVNYFVDKFCVCLE